MQYGRPFFIAECGIKILKKQLSVPTRIGIVVPKKLTKTIVKRNRIKRQIRHIFIKLLSSIPPGHDIVFLTRPRFLDLTFDAMKERIEYLLSKTISRNSK